MSGDIDFTPRLGRIRDRGASGGKSFRRQVRQAAARLQNPAGKPGFTGRNIGRGNGATPQAMQSLRQISRARMRRVIVKVHIARARGGSGVRAFSEHVRYIQRDGVERDGSGGELYGPEGQQVDGRDFAERSGDDRHQFRLTVSAEDASQLGDLKASTRKLMTQMEQDLGTRLDWVAVDHHNTGHSHTHIVIRGKDARGEDLVIAKNYLTQGIRGRAQQIVTNELGPRRDLEIAAANQRETTQDRFTSIDRDLERKADTNRVEITPAHQTGDRFRRSLELQRLQHLERLHLAVEDGPGMWRLIKGWQNALKAMGRRGDIVRTLAAGLEPGETARGVRFFEERPRDAKAVTGVVISSGPDDELRSTRFLLVEDLDGTRWHVPANGVEPGSIPPRGAIVEISSAQAAPRASDKVIARVASQTGGYYSDALHAEADPTASYNYREAHKRRLEALRRAGLVTRRSDGVWNISDDYLSKASEFEARKGGGIKITVRSWMTLEAQIEARADTWLDRPEGAASVKSERLSNAHDARRAFLRRERLISDGEDRLSENTRNRRRMMELNRAAAKEGARSGRNHIELTKGDGFEGKFEKAVDLASGRMALIGNQKAFALVPWRPDLERHRGRTLLIEQRAKGLSWSFPSGRARGLSR
ncbi:MAG: DUF3363 domain-containing protein [Henriciella sp.]|nr:DUF3363 domain-containing protein [Henriciella sp.]